MAGCCQNMSNCTGSLYRDVIPLSVDGKQRLMVVILEEKGQGVSNTRNLNPSSSFMLSGSNLVSDSLYRRHSLSWGWRRKKASQNEREGIRNASSNEDGSAPQI